MSRTWFVRQGDAIYGPYGSRKLKEMALNGDIMPHSELSNAETGPWNPASKIQGLQFASAPPPRPLADVTTKPQSSSLQSPNEQPVQTVELTSKKYKLMQLVGFVIAMLSLLLFLPSLYLEWTPAFIASLLLFLVGLVVLVYGRIMGWWHHG